MVRQVSMLLSPYTSFSLSSPPPGSISCSLCLFLHCCPVNKFNGTIFLDSISMHQGNVSGKVGTIKGRKGIDLTESEDIKKMWQAYTEKLYKKDLHNPDNHNGVITSCQTSWSVKSSGLRQHL